MCFHNGCVWDSFFDSPPPFFSLSIGFRVLYDFFFVCVSLGRKKSFSTVELLLSFSYALLLEHRLRRILEEEEED